MLKLPSFVAPKLARRGRLGASLQLVIVVVTCFFVATSENRAAAAVAVLSNRTGEPLVAAVYADDQPPRPLAIDPGASRPVFGLKKLVVRWSDGQDVQNTELTPGCAYFVSRPDAGRPLQLRQIGLNGHPGPPLVIAEDNLLLDSAPTLRVKVLVDDDERRPRSRWEPELRKRVADASAVLQAHCGVQLQLVGFDRWDSDDNENDFMRSMAEFEREVAPGDADVAIGFSSQYAVQRGRFHMGGTRKPLHTHILIKERARGILDTERLELLVHELGHLLGASHSPEPTSVMRPVLLGGLQRTAGATVQFDPVNTLTMALLADEMRLRQVRSLGEITKLTRRRLQQVYAALDPALPEDPAAGLFQKIIGASAGTAVIDDARKIIAGVERVAKLKDKAPLTSLHPGETDVARSDLLLEWYVRQGAAAATRVNPETAPQAYLLAMGAVLDRDGLLSELPLLATLEGRLASPTERERRAAVLGEPTMRGRADLTKHFFVSAHLVAVLGTQKARAAGLVKELADSHGGSGFSFVDMAANRAGIVFAHAVLAERLPLERVAREFTIDAVLPPLDDLREGMQADQFTADFGGLTDERLQGELRRIETRVIALPLYSGGHE